MIESAVERYLVHRVKELGGLCEKTEPGDGFPDRLVLWPDGTTALVELKRPKGGVLSAKQAHMHKVLERMGHKVWLIHTKQEVDNFIEGR